jgi:taurine dioxygenase
MEAISGDRPLGTEIRGLDLASGLDDQDFAALKACFDQDGMVYLRGQTLSPGQLIEFTARFGKPDRHVRQEYSLPGYPEIHLISNVKEEERSIGSAYAGDDWHTDLCFMRYPGRYTFLYAVEVPVKDGRVLGETRFASTSHAYDTLDTDTRHWLERQRGVFRYHRAQERKRAQRANDHARPPLTEAQKAATPDLSHDAVITHPATGRRCIYVNKSYTFSFEGLSEDESDPILRRIHGHVVRDEAVYVHRWQVGDLIMWDNYSTQHMAVGDYALPQRRLMYRTAICGTEDFGARLLDGE